MASGPFEMSLGESQQIVLALIGGLGADNLSSINILKQNDIQAQVSYDNNFTLLGVNATSSFISSDFTEVNVTANVISSINSVTVDFTDNENNVIISVPLFDDSTKSSHF